MSLHKPNNNDPPQPLHPLSHSTPTPSLQRRGDRQLVKWNQFIGVVGLLRKVLRMRAEVTSDL